MGLEFKFQKFNLSPGNKKKKAKERFITKVTFELL